MKKLQLNLETLAVESFAAGQTVEPRGTVRGNALPVTHPLACPASQNWYCSVGQCSVDPRYCP